MTRNWGTVWLRAKRRVLIDLIIIIWPSVTCQREFLSYAGGESSPTSVSHVLEYPVFVIEPCMYVPYVYFP